MWNKVVDDAFVVANVATRSLDGAETKFECDKLLFCDGGVYA